MAPHSFLFSYWFYPDLGSDMTQSDILLQLGMMNQAMKLIHGVSENSLSRQKVETWLGVKDPESLTRAWNTYIAPLLDDLGPFARLCKDNLLREVISGVDPQDLALECRKALKRASL